MCRDQAHVPSVHFPRLGMDGPCGFRRLDSRGGNDAARRRHGGRHQELAAIETPRVVVEIFLGHDGVHQSKL
jgi:hypothetical protein